MNVTQNLTTRPNEATLLWIVQTVVAVPELLRYPPRSPVAGPPPPRPRGIWPGRGVIISALVLVISMLIGGLLVHQQLPAGDEQALLVVLPPLTATPSLPTPSPAVDTMTPPAPSAVPTEDQTHITVLAGESAEDVARRAGSSVEAFIAANGLRQADGTIRAVYAGEILNRPPAESAVAAAPAPTMLRSSAPPPDATHQVLPGETVAQIAGQFGISVAALVGRNNLTNPNLITPGQVLIIPDAAYIPPAWAQDRLVAQVIPPTPVAANPAAAPPLAPPPSATPVPLRIAALPDAAGGGSDQTNAPAPTLPPAPPTPCPTYVVEGTDWYAKQALSLGQWAIIRPDQILVVLSTCGDVYQEIRKAPAAVPPPHLTNTPVTQTIPAGGLDVVIQEPLYRIAGRYGWTVDDLVRANSGLDPTQDNHGRTIHVPAH